MIVSRAFAGKRSAVLGLARSGLATVESLHASGAQVTAWDRRPGPREAVAPIAAIGDPMAIDLAGFIDAPQIGPANIASSPITDPMAIPAVIPFSLAPVDTLRMTSMRMKVSTISRMKLWLALPAGRVAPSVSSAGKSARKSPLEAKAPSNCAPR